MNKGVVLRAVLAVLMLWLAGPLGTQVPAPVLKRAPVRPERSLGPAAGLISRYFGPERVDRAGVGVRRFICALRI